MTEKITFRSNIVYVLLQGGYQTEELPPQSIKSRKSDRNSGRNHLISDAASIEWVGEDLLQFTSRNQFNGCIDEITPGAQWF